MQYIDKILTDYGVFCKNSIVTSGKNRSLDTRNIQLCGEEGVLLIGRRGYEAK
jgi:hypothetical protein